MEKEQHLDLDIDLDIDLVAATLTAGILGPFANGLDLTTPNAKGKVAYEAVELYAEVLRALEKKFPAQD